MRAIPRRTAHDSVVPDDPDADSGVGPDDHPRIGRFRLDDLIFGDRTSGLWRGYDERLKRAVSVRVIPASDHRQRGLRAGALVAAAVVDRRVAQVLDVIDVDTSLVIVAEWVEGINLEEFLQTPMAPARAIAIAREVAAAVQSIHEAGAFHGRLRPASVIITGEGEVRLRGHCIDVELWGISPGQDPLTADIYGIGAVLMACLTTRWPGQPPTNLRSVPVFGDRVATPSQLRADLSDDINDFVIRALAAVPSASGLTAPDAFTSVARTRRALGSLTDAPAWTGVVPIVKAPPHSEHPDHISGKSAARRGLGILVAASVITTCAAIGGALLIGGGSDDTANATVNRTPATTTPSIEPRSLQLPNADAPTTAVRTIPLERELPVTGVSSFDPQGDGLINGEYASFANDPDPATAWYTRVYPEHAQGRKAGSGILLDLGFPRSVRALELGLIGNDSDLEIRVGDRRSRSIADYKLIDTVKAAPASLTVREPRPVTTRYVLVLLTAVPAGFDGFRGGIASVHVRGD